MVTVSLRPCVAFGECDTSFLTKALTNAQKGFLEYQIGSGNNVHNFVYVGFLADAHILAAQALILRKAAAFSREQSRWRDFQHYKR